MPGLGEKCRNNASRPISVHRVGSTGKKFAKSPNKNIRESLC